jgi:hypothetical protein
VPSETFDSSIEETIGDTKSEDDEDYTAVKKEYTPYIPGTTDRLTHLKQFTNYAEILAAVDSVAFTQRELEKLLKETDKTEIYLCGDSFTIPYGERRRDRLRRKIKGERKSGCKRNITYIGVNGPRVIPPTDYLERGVKFRGVLVSISVISCNASITKSHRLRKSPQICGQ